MVLDADLPELLGGPVVDQLEPDRALEGLKFSRPDFDVEVGPLVRDFEDFGPGEPVDAESVGAGKTGSRPRLIWFE